VEELNLPPFYSWRVGAGRRYFGVSRFEISYFNIVYRKVFEKNDNLYIGKLKKLLLKIIKLKQENFSGVTKKF